MMWMLAFVLGGETLKEDVYIAETGVFQVLLPEEVFVRPDGQVYVVNFDEAQIQHYDGEGRPVGKIGRKGKGPGEFTFPTRVALVGEYFYVQDALTGFVSRFALNGEFKDRVKLPGRPVVARKTSGGWFHYGFSYDTLQGVPSALKFSDDAFENGKTVVPIADTGRREEGIATLTDGRGMTAAITPIPVAPRLLVSPDGTKLYLADAHKFEIAVFDGGTGKHLRTQKKSGKAIPFDREWADEHFAESIRDLHQRHPGVQVKKLYPDVFPAIRALCFDPDGNLVVDRWRGRPDDHHDPVAFNGQGQPTESKYSWPVLQRLCGVVGETAFVMVYDEEEAGIAKVPLAELETFVSANPISDWTHRYNFFIGN